MNAVIEIHVCRSVSFASTTKERKWVATKTCNQYVALKVYYWVTMNTSCLSTRVLEVTMPPKNNMQHLKRIGISYLHTVSAMKWYR